MVGRLATMSTIMQESIIIGEPIITYLEHAKHHQAPRPRRDTARTHMFRATEEASTDNHQAYRPAGLQTGRLNLFVHLQPGDLPVIIVARPNGDNIALP